MTRTLAMEAVLGDAHEALAHVLDGQPDLFEVARVMRHIDKVLRGGPARRVVLFDEVQP